MQEGEPGSVAHLPLDHFRSRVHAFGPAVMERQGDGCDGGLLIEVQSAGEALDVWQVAGSGALDPVRPPAWDTIPVSSAETMIFGRRAVFCM